MATNPTPQYPSWREREALRAEESTVKAAYVAGDTDRETYQAQLATIHAGIARVQGFRRCNCAACREYRERVGAV